MNLSVLYRGDLSSCNYDCPYCPFAKRKDSRATLATDARQVARFVAFVAGQQGVRFKVFFTPWGEGLIRKTYQRAIIELSRMAHVDRVAIQTNLSCGLQWLQEADRSKVALWTTYHPGQVSRETFLNKCRQLDVLGVTYSVGVVGFKETIDEIEALRAFLPPQTYLWVNAIKKTADYYEAAEKARLVAIDPFLPYNMVNHLSKDKACRTGHTVISIDGAGDMYRCHFIKEKLGNLYVGDFRAALFPRTCTNATCGCHIGYVHMDELGLYDVFQGRELERVVVR